MVKLITDFKNFSEELDKKSVRTVKFEIDDEEFELKYSELKNKDESRVEAEFKSWLEGNEGGPRDITKDTYRFYKMIVPHLDKRITFDEFLSMPRMVVSAMVTAIEMDLIERYPHIKAHLNLALGK